MLTSRFTPEFLSRAAEQLGWDATTAGQAKRADDLALLQELMATTAAHPLRPGSCAGGSPPY
jgi:hypothetical protein